MPTFNPVTSEMQGTEFNPLGGNPASIHVYATTLILLHKEQHFHGELHSTKEITFQKISIK